MPSRIIMFIRNIRDITIHIHLDLNFFARFIVCILMTYKIKSIKYRRIFRFIDIF